MDRMQGALSPGLASSGGPDRSSRPLPYTSQVELLSIEFHAARERALSWPDSPNGWHAGGVYGAPGPDRLIGYGVYWRDGLREPWSRRAQRCVLAYLDYTDRALPQLKKGEPLMTYRLTLAAILSTAALVTLGAAAGFPASVHYIDHNKVAAAFVKGERIIEDQGLIVIAQRVVGRGSEMHDNINHVFIMQDGEAEFITGGKLVDAKVTEPGQTRGTGIEGGVSHHLS